MHLPTVVQNIQKFLRGTAQPPLFIQHGQGRARIKPAQNGDQSIDLLIRPTDALLALEPRWSHDRHTHDGTHENALLLSPHQDGSGLSRKHTQGWSHDRSGSEDSHRFQENPPVLIVIPMRHIETPLSGVV